MQHLLDALADQRNLAMNQLAQAQAALAAERDNLHRLAQCVLSEQVPAECVPVLCDAHPGLAGLLRVKLPDAALTAPVGQEVGAAGRV